MSTKKVISLALLSVIAVTAFFALSGYAFASSWLPAPFDTIPICVAGTNAFPCIGNSPFWTVAPITMTGTTATQVANLAAHVLRCSIPDPTIYGLAVGTVYCVKGYIGIAALVYTENLRSSNFMFSYHAAAYLLAAAMFGTRMMTLHTHNITKDTFQLLIRFAMSLFLVSNSMNIYIWVTDGMGQLSGYVTNAMTLGTIPNSCAVIEPLKMLLQAVDPAVNYAEYEPWHYIDCLLMRLTGATASSPLSSIALPPPVPEITKSFLSSILPGWLTSTTAFSLLPNYIPTLISSSVLMILITALTTSTVGFGLAAVGVWAVVAILKLILRCLYLTLLAYLMVGMTVIMLPLFAPLLVFNTHDPDAYTYKVFKRWMAQIGGAFLQPPLYIGFLSFAVVLIHAMFEGNVSNVPAVQAIFAGCNQGQQTNRICAFNDLFRTGNEKLARTVLSDADANYLAATGDFSWITSTKTPWVNWRVIGDPQTAAYDCKAIDRSRSFIPKTVVDRTHQIASKAVSMIIPGPERLSEDYMVMLQGLLTLLCAILIVSILSSLLEIIPKMSASIINAASVSLFDAMRMPLEGVMGQAFTGAKKGMAGSGGRGLLMGGGLSGAMDNVAKLRGNAFKGVYGAVNQLTKMLSGR